MIQYWGMWMMFAITALVFCFMLQYWEDIVWY